MESDRRVGFFNHETILRRSPLDDPPWVWREEPLHLVEERETVG